MISTADGGQTRYEYVGAVLASHYPEGELHPSGARYYHRDHLGSVTDVTDRNGRRIGQLDYGPFGQTELASGTLTDFRYAGMFQHQPSGLYLTHYRAYDPVSARWLSRDPIGEAGGVNLYGYVLGNPVSYVDPNGLWSWSFDAYAGWGGGITIGRYSDAGRWFVLGRLGFGFGGGFGFDPFDKGPSSRPRRLDPYGNVCPTLPAPSTGTSAGTFVGTGGSLGALNFGYGGGAGRNFDGTGTSYGGDLGPNSSINPFTHKRGVSIGGAAGFEVGGWW